MFYKTQSHKKKRVATWFNGSLFRNDKHIEVILIETWWVLFVPIYTRQTSLHYNM